MFITSSVLSFETCFLPQLQQEPTIVSLTIPPNSVQETSSTKNVSGKEIKNESGKEAKNISGKETKIPSGKEVKNMPGKGSKGKIPPKEVCTKTITYAIYFRIWFIIRQINYYAGQIFNAAEKQDSITSNIFIAHFD